MNICRNLQLTAIALAGVAGGGPLAWASGAMAADLPSGPYGGAPAEQAVRACSEHGGGFFAIPGSDTCLRIGGMVEANATMTTPQERGASSRYGVIVTGRIDADARTSTDWGALRTFVRFDISSLTGTGVSGDKARLGSGFGATGVDTWGKAQKGVDVSRAFIQFGGLTAGRASSFFEFYAYDVEMLGATPASDASPVNLLAWTFGLGKGWSLTLSAEDGIWRRRPVAWSGAVHADGSWSPDGWTPGATPVALVPLGAGPDGRPIFGRVDVRQRDTMPDVVAALRLDRSWGALQFSGALRRLDVRGTVRDGNGAIVAGHGPAGKYGGAVQAGVMLNLPALGDGDRLWLQAAWGRGALSYTGAAPLGFDTLNGNQFGKITAWSADALVGPDGQLRLSRSWSAVAALQHYWRPDFAQSVFAGYGRVSYGRGLTAGMGTAGGFAGPIPGNGVLAVGTRLDWEPVKDLFVSGEVAWTRLRNSRPAVEASRVAWTPRQENGWNVRLQIQRSF